MEIWLKLGTVVGIYAAMLISPDSTFACTSKLSNTRSPYAISSFRSVMDASKFQAPTSSTCYRRGSSSGRLSNTASYNKWFYARNGSSQMVFAMDRNSDSSSASRQRAELRQEDEWSIAQTNKMIARVKFESISSNLSEFTFMQVHMDESGAKPMLRLSYIRQRGSTSHGVWATLRTTPNGSFDKQLLFTVPPGSSTRNNFQKVEIRIDGGTLRVKHNDATKYTKSVSSYGGKRMYFKAGAYLQDTGDARVAFSSLNYYRN